MVPTKIKNAIKRNLSQTRSNDYTIIIRRPIYASINNNFFVATNFVINYLVTCSLLLCKGTSFAHGALPQADT